MSDLVRRAAPLLLVALIIWAWSGLDIDLTNLRRAGDAISEFWPPDLTVWRAALDGLVETVQIALLGTALGFALSVPLGLLAATNLFPAPTAAPVRILAAAVRVPPSILWAILFVILLGLGPLAGIAAIAVYTTGFLAKLQYEAYEGLPRDPLDALRAMGGSRLQVAWHAAIPETANILRSQALFMFEYNVRASTVIGIVGAGGIGQLLRIQLQFFQYDRITVTLLIILATVLLLDAVSLLVRRRFIEGAMERPRWRDVLVGTRRGPRTAPRHNT